MNEKKYSFGEMENLAHLSADLMKKLHRVKMPAGHQCERFDSTQDRIQFLVEKAVELEKRLGGVNEKEGNYNYFEELDKFEEEILKEVEKY